MIKYVYKFISFGIIFIIGGFKMIISELIEKLKKYPSDLRVVIPGKKSGYSDVEGFEIIEKCVLNFNKSIWGEGAHQKIEYPDDSEIEIRINKENIVKVLSIC
jgi:hypothetical protein